MTTIVLTDNQMTVVVTLATFLWCAGWILSAALHTSQLEDKSTAFDFLVWLVAASALVVMLVALFVIAFESNA